MTYWLGPSFDEHLTNLQNVFVRFREYGLRLKPKKCDLFRRSVEFLGRSVSNQGLQIGQQHLQPVSGWVVPTSTKEVEQFLGFVNYHRSFVKDYAKISAPLYEVTGKNWFSWNHERQLAFQTCYLHPYLLCLTTRIISSWIRTPPKCNRRRTHSDARWRGTDHSIW